MSSEGIVEEAKVGMLGIVKVGRPMLSLKLYPVPARQVSIRHSV